ncbi:MAG: hypothetical protein R6U96_18680 [Promethearchaeia archaeon]
MSQTNNKKRIEISLPEQCYYFFKARAILKGKKIDKEIEDFLKEEGETLKNCSFQDALI